MIDIKPNSLVFNIVKTDIPMFGIVLRSGFPADSKKLGKNLCLNIFLYKIELYFILYYWRY